MSNSSVKVGSVWKDIHSISVNVSSVWKVVSSGWVNISGIWKSFFSAGITPSIASPVTISSSSGSYPATLTGTNYHWTDGVSYSYQFEASADNTTWIPISGASGAIIINPVVSNTVTYVTAPADYPALTTYFRFTVTAVSTTPLYFTSYSTSTVVTIAAAPVNTIAPTLITNVSPYNDFYPGTVITGSLGTWTGATSYSAITLEASYDNFATAPYATYANVRALTDFDGLSPSTWYRAVVTAWSGASQTGVSTTVYSTHYRARLAIISGSPSYAPLSSTSANATWTINKGALYVDSTYVSVYRASDNAFMGNFSPSSLSSPVTATITGLAPGGTYYGNITVVNNDDAHTSVTITHSSIVFTTSVFVVSLPSISPVPNAPYLGSPITYSGGSYTGASSVTTVLLYSTSTSNLVSPGGNTYPTYYTGGSHTVAPTDANPPPYYFAVRDTVVVGGFNNYYYSSITQATLAPAPTLTFSTPSVTSSSIVATITNFVAGDTYTVTTSAGTAPSGTQTISTILVTGISGGTTVTVTLSGYKRSGYNLTSGSFSGTTTITPIIPTISGVNYPATYDTALTLQWSSTNQVSYSITGSLSASGTTSTFANFTGLSQLTTYSGTITVTSSTGHTASASYSVTTAATFATPAASAPVMTWVGNNHPVAGSQQWSWTSVSPGGSYSSWYYEWHMSLTNGGADIASGSTSGTTLQTGTTALRWARVRVVMLGTDSNYYYSAYSNWA